MSIWIDESLKKYDFFEAKPDQRAGWPLTICIIERPQPGHFDGSGVASGSLCPQALHWHLSGIVPFSNGAFSNGATHDAVSTLPRRCTGLFTLHPQDGLTRSSLTIKYIG